MQTESDVNTFVKNVTRSMKQFESSELILTSEGKIYHLNLHPSQIADDIILVGDPGRVEAISAYFDNVEHRVTNREFVTHTGRIGNKRLTVMSSGIGTDNIDIVVNELDALANIDLEKRREKEKKRQLNLIRLGTSGALHSSLDVDSFVISKYGLGIDNLGSFYSLDEHVVEQAAVTAFMEHSNWQPGRSTPYIVENSRELDELFPDDLHRGITVTAPGFYGPQGRQLRIEPSDEMQNQKLAGFSWNGVHVANYEMETSALYALGRQLGHNTLSICAIIANRAAGAYSRDHKSAVKKLIELVLETII